MRNWLAPLTPVFITPLLRATISKHSVPSGSPWRRACDSCGKALGLRPPVAAYAPTGRCPSCSLKIGAPAFSVEAAALAAGALVALVSRSPLEALAVAWWAGTVIVLAFIDWAVHRLPDRITYPAAGGVVALLALSVPIEDHAAADLARAVGAGLSVAGGLALLTLTLGRRGPGLGDAKLMLGTGTLLGWFGWHTVFVGVAVALVAQGLWATALLVRRRASTGMHLPMGPFLIVGAAVGVATTS